ncbi:hypothetical protein FJT64_020384 [Amphibalanus amphitrite]|uniref:Uncharacterized protein n=1 Tax=Amphibalanus amphitrite TaxID=1232801 RepID=A0A6A4WQU5_AMPAM|nr:hypothetical protein FJT64_020384 [Amphibalanus amphitrite]
MRGQVYEPTRCEASSLVATLLFVYRLATVLSPKLRRRLLLARGSRYGADPAIDDVTRKCGYGDCEGVAKLRHLKTVQRFTYDVIVDVSNIIGSFFIAFAIVVTSAPTAAVIWRTASLHRTSYFYVLILCLLDGMLGGTIFVMTTAVVFSGMLSGGLPKLTETALLAAISVTFNIGIDVATIFCNGRIILAASKDSMYRVSSLGISPHHTTSLGRKGFFVGFNVGLGTFGSFGLPIGS